MMLIEANFYHFLTVFTGMQQLGAVYRISCWEFKVGEFSNSAIGSLKPTFNNLVVLEGLNEE